MVVIKRIGFWENKNNRKKNRPNVHDINRTNAIVYIYIKMYRIQIEYYNRIPSIRNESEKKTNAPELLQAYITWVVAFLKRTIFPKIVFSYFYLLSIISYLRNFNQFDILNFGRRYWCIGLKICVRVLY